MVAVSTQGTTTTLGYAATVSTQGAATTLGFATTGSTYRDDDTGGGGDDDHNEREELEEVATTTVAVFCVILCIMFVMQVFIAIGDLPAQCVEFANLRISRLTREGEGRDTTDQPGIPTSGKHLALFRQRAEKGADKGAGKGVQHKVTEAKFARDKAKKLGRSMTKAFFMKMRP